VPIGDRQVAEDPPVALARLRQLPGDFVRKSFIFKGAVGEIVKT
jgi:hypothetical protein